MNKLGDLVTTLSGQWLLYGLAVVPAQREKCLKIINETAATLNKLEEELRDGKG